VRGRGGNEERGVRYMKIGKGGESGGEGGRHIEGAREWGLDAIGKERRG
jgi:hypothetical protein